MLLKGSLEKDKQLKSIVKECCLHPSKIIYYGVGRSAITLKETGWFDLYDQSGHVLSLHEHLTLTNSQKYLRTPGNYLVSIKDLYNFRNDHSKQHYCYLKGLITKLDGPDLLRYLNIAKRLSRSYRNHRLNKLNFLNRGELSPRQIISVYFKSLCRKIKKENKHPFHCETR